MSQVELLTAEQAPLLAQPFYARGDPGPIVRALAHVPELMEPALSFIAAAFGPSQLDSRLKEIVVLRVSAANRCHYCIETHTGVAQRMCFSAEEIAALRREAPPPSAWGDVEHALLAFSDALSDHPDKATASLRPLFGEAEIVELVTVGSATIMLNRFATSLGLPA
ncbi:MAG: carboxymuconolactone decarboxylase family protein [Candidatus Dormibacteraeota bacterium]|uniref:Carboxymuconolactone decarboxylase family protein n=1 Tax=Candidatus Dormiibacter inghamiae TaxID=3127013 RepID=A0A934KGA0_9BACT|nr:carboxymuconolactone decarboxylase family protein [Candidatus Dormibacteraeota bacterium]MBJ7606019.1 carboxymuconolactone decarboxylase family protein [Candidatus Dormibacteraeota bacterium]